MVVVVMEREGLGRGGEGRGGGWMGFWDWVVIGRGAGMA